MDAIHLATAEIMELIRVLAEAKLVLEDQKS